VSTEHPRTVIATGASLTLGVAIAVAVGAIPQVSAPPHPDPVEPHGVVQPEVARLLLNPAAVTADAAAPTRRVMPTTHHHVATASTTLSRNLQHARVHVGAHLSDPVASVTVEPAEATPKATKTANIKHATPHKKKHHKKHHHHKKAHKPAKFVPAPRTTPSASAVTKAIAGLRNFVRTPFTPTASQVGQFGDAVCSAFDKRQTFSQVKAAILQQVKKLPFTTVMAGAADYVVKTAVSLYCPGYKSKVS
jgi:hypothetical protein